MTKIVFYGYEWQRGLDIKLTIYDSEGEIMYTDLEMIEKGTDTGVYTYDVVNLPETLERGEYTIKLEAEEDFEEFFGVLWDGYKFFNITDIQTTNLTGDNIKEMRDALGLSGDKKIAKDGQLQKKSEYPYNTTIDTKNIYNE